MRRDEKYRIDVSPGKRGAPREPVESQSAGPGTQPLGVRASPGSQYDGPINEALFNWLHRLAGLGQRPFKPSDAGSNPAGVIFITVKNLIKICHKTDVLSNKLAF